MKLIVSNSAASQDVKKSLDTCFSDLQSGLKSLAGDLQEQLDDCLKRADGYKKEVSAVLEDSKALDTVRKEFAGGLATLDNLIKSDSVYATSAEVYVRDRKYHAVFRAKLQAADVASAATAITALGARPSSKFSPHVACRGTGLKQTFKLGDLFIAVSASKPARKTGEGLKDTAFVYLTVYLVASVKPPVYDRLF